MTVCKKPRVMWLLNHGTARKFEVNMLKKIGIEEIYLPKIIPDDISFRSASIDYSEDANLTIPAHELAVLNDQNWYLAPSQEAWEIVNRYFDFLFFILHEENFLKDIAKNYKGIALWRAYGLDRSISYTKILNSCFSPVDIARIKAMNSRFYFAQAYDHLHQIEDNFLQEKALK